MEAHHARYPFLTAAREAVREADVELAQLVSQDGPVLNRARERVETAIDSDTVGEPRRSNRIELLSYPVARVLVSIIDEPGLTNRYARAEAQTAINRLTNESATGSELRSVSVEPLTTEELLDELALADAVDSTASGYRMEVGPYLDLSDDLADRRWRLDTRSLSAGWVPINPTELETLLREAIQRRIESGLPLDVPDTIVDSLTNPIHQLRDRLADHRPAAKFSALRPNEFPPCMTALLEQLEDSSELAPHSRFSLLAFLAAIGMDSEEIVDRMASHPDITTSTVRSQLERLRETDGSLYPPPSCETMVAYGDCVNRDALCERIAHPLDYYHERLEGTDPDQLSQTDNK